MDPTKRKEYADTIDRFLDDPSLREQMREDALKVLESLNFDLTPEAARQAAEGIGLHAPGGGPQANVLPLVAVAVFVASQVSGHDE